MMARECVYGELRNAMAAAEVARAMPGCIPEPIKHEVAKTAYEAVLRYFDQPGVQKKFERWKAECANEAARLNG